MLVRPGRIARHSAAGGSGKAGVAEHIQVRGRRAWFRVPLGARNARGRFVSCMRWFETADNRHVLLTPGYQPKTLTVIGRGGMFRLREPVEVPNRGGVHFYIAAWALTRRMQAIPIMQ